LKWAAVFILFHGLTSGGAKASPLFLLRLQYLRGNINFSDGFNKDKNSPFAFRYSKSVGSGWGRDSDLGPFGSASSVPRVGRFVIVYFFSPAALVAIPK
jgi:hypothetical protein